MSSPQGRSTDNCRRARLTVERLEDRFLPSINLFDPLPSLDDLFAADPAFAKDAPPPCSRPR